MDASLVGRSSLSTDNSHQGSAEMPLTGYVPLAAPNVPQQGVDQQETLMQVRGWTREPRFRFFATPPPCCVQSQEDICVTVPVLKPRATLILKIDEEDDGDDPVDDAKSAEDTVEGTFDFCDDKSDTRHSVCGSSDSVSARSDDDHTADDNLQDDDSPIADDNLTTSPESSPYDDAPSHICNAGIHYTTIHHVSCDFEPAKCFTETPTRGLGVFDHLEGGFQILNLPMYLATYPDLSFVVFYEYRCHHGPARMRTGSDDVQRETIRPVSAFLTKTFLEIAKYDWNELHSVSPQNNVRPQAIAQLFVPFPESLGNTYGPVFLYHHREALAAAEDPNGEVARLLKYIQEKFRPGSEFRLADQQFASGIVSAETIKYLFVPHDFLVSPVHGTEYTKISRPLRLACYVLAYRPLITSLIQTANLDCWRWSYTGYKLRRSDMVFEICLPKRGELVRITDLVAYPLKFAPEGVKESLIRRGKFFWDKLRFPTHMAYEGWCWYQHRNFPKNTKVFVDYKILNSTLPQSKYVCPPCSLRAIDGDPYPDVILNTVGDLGELALLIPADVVGFVMEKIGQWRRVQLDQISEIAWDSNAFSRVVLPSKTKDIAAALVLSRMLREGDSSYEERFRGKCLTIHLHGPPGTGKTRLARALAEKVHMPIYLKQAGTIATVAQDWRTFYQNVHLLQSSANFILLLDKADGYLRKRGPCVDGSFEPHDAEFMSMFVRLLDQFPGIIILTSATIAAEDMDPNVRSQINASFAFRPLDDAARRVIWTENLATAGCTREAWSADENNRFEEVLKKELNGWQIKNTVEAAADFARLHTGSLQWTDLAMALEMMDGEDNVEEM